ncbi:zinc finger MYND domain-containing protein [Phanerochaete sordida]|uniref:Zinc finger MYND domain-containing protein n=1 Tax=Phanerochaete sordida TaxID=48140 RepID=A0A9P3GGK7_9APHY|nr:zinc finger MYND domain-containing protein [Phanerochaete sordida]
MKTCRNCKESIRDSQGKTCSRCRNDIYCSRECQVAAWPKHKALCFKWDEIPWVPDNLRLDDPEQGLGYAMDMKINEEFQKWMTRWERVLDKFTVAGFDLANQPNPAEHGRTHCIAIYVAPNREVKAGRRSNLFKVVKGEVHTVAEMRTEYKTHHAAADWARLERLGTIPTTLVIRLDFAGEPRTGMWVGENVQNRREILEISARLPKTLSAYIAATWVDWLAHIVATRNCNDFTGATDALSEAKYQKLYVGIGKRRAARLGTRFEKDSDDQALFWSQPFFRQMLGLRSQTWSEEHLMRITMEEPDEFFRVFGRVNAEGELVEVADEAESDWEDIDELDS